MRDTGESEVRQLKPYTKPLPTLGGLASEYWASACEEHLKIQRCGKCRWWRFPPAECCPHCLSFDSEWTPIVGTGVIWTRIFMHQKYFDGFAEDIPYNVVWVKLDEGPMMTANIVGARHEDILVGAPVQLIYDHVTEYVTIPRFKLLHGEPRG
jgi:uncharacterized OB-fold protein